MYAREQQVVLQDALFVLSKQWCDLFVTMLDGADQSCLPSGRKAASLKTLHTFWISKCLLGHAADCLQLFCSLHLCSPQCVSRSFLLLLPSPAHAYMHTNMCPCLQLSPWPKLLPGLFILPPFLSIIQSGPFCWCFLNTFARERRPSSIQERRALNIPSYLLQ